MARNLIVIGGNGALGSSFVKVFKTDPWKILSIDFRPNIEADGNIELNHSSFLKENIPQLKNQVRSFANEFDLIVNVAGGWQGVNFHSDSVFESLDLMLKQNLFSSVLAVNLSYTFLKKHSHLVLTGAMSPYLNQGYNFMSTYQLAKQSVHHLTDLINSNKKDNFRILTLLP